MVQATHGIEVGGKINGGGALSVGIVCCGISVSNNQETYRLLVDLWYKNVKSVCVFS